jgi:phosphatidylserine/phosphatidylglycerophosphate/cardiolipin synthase-like enzyme
VKPTKITSWHFILILAAVVLFLTDRIKPSAPETKAPAPVWQVHFSPSGGATDAIIEALDDARISILVQAYSFTSERIAQALARAHARGVQVQVLLDKSQRTQKYTVVDLLNRADIPTLIDADHAIAHNKVMIINKRIVITGSFNFTKAAEERNAENLLVISDVDLADRYTENWRAHQALRATEVIYNLVTRPVR